MGVVGGVGGYDRRTMATITIDGKECGFEQGDTILQVANANGITIPQYCYHDGLTIVASCRICLAEVWAPNPRNDNKLEAIPKLLPTCQTTCGEGQVVYTDSPKAIANQKAVMEYLLINHPLDCPVCDQSGECSLQDYSYEYGRGVSRFEETKIKQPKKDVGPHVLLYSDRCIMCSRCVRFTREVTGTAELTITGRGNKEQIDVFPGVALDNELSANVIDLCPVGALLDKDFLFSQRVWFLKETPSIDGITSSGDNITVHHNQGLVYRIKPRTNMDVNKWWISDEIRFGWKFVHDEGRLTGAAHKKFGARAACDFVRAYDEIVENMKGKKIALVVSPMLSCEEAYALAKAAVALGGKGATLCVGPVPRDGTDKVFPGGYTVRAEKAPNARGVRRVLEAVAQAEGLGEVLDARGFEGGSFEGVLVTGNYPSDWVTAGFAKACEGAFTVVIDTLGNRLTEAADIVLPGAVWLEKAGVFENAQGKLQAFEQAVPSPTGARSEGQIALDLLAVIEGSGMEQRRVERRVMVVDEGPGQVPGATEVLLPGAAHRYNAAHIRREMAGEYTALSVFETEVSYPVVEAQHTAEMELVEL